MKLNRISINNVLGVRHAEIAPHAPALPPSIKTLEAAIRWYEEQ